MPLPAILHWQQNNHFVVLMPGSTKSKLMVADPAMGEVALDKHDFIAKWISVAASGKKKADTNKGIALIFENTPQIKNNKTGDATHSDIGKINKQYLFGYIRQHKISFLKILLCLLIGSGLQLIFPYLTQSIVDKGINTRDINFIQLVLAAQLMLLFSQSVIEFIRSRIYCISVPK